MAGAHHKSFGLRQKAAGAPSPEQLALIGAYTHREFGADELMVRTYALAHNCIDRDKECFDEGLLADFARSLPGKGVFIIHPTSWQGDGGPGEGRVFEASLRQMALDEARTFLREPGLTLPPDRTMVTVLMASAYYARTEENGALLTKMDAGIVSDVSIGFNASERNRIKGPDGVELNAWRWVGPGEALEMSLVWLGAQPGARGVKGATRNEDNDMNLQEQLDAANGRIKTLETEKTGADATANKFNAVKSALGDDALADNPAQLRVLVDAGKAYRKSLVDRLVAADRVAGDVKDDEASVKAAADEYGAMPTNVLEKLVGKSALATTTTEEPGVKGSDPNAGKGGPSGTKATGIFANPLIGGVAATA